jgi:hypothetical protein
MPDLLKPDMKSLLWLALGMFVLPKVIGAVRSKTSKS